MVELEVPVPNTKKGIQAMCKDFEAFMVGALKRRAVEVNERKLNAEDYQKFQEAKATEVRNFVAAKAFEALPPELKPDKSQAIGMRWILTWKLKDDGSYKPKARAILQGYQDPGYEHRATTTRDDSIGTLLLSDAGQLRRETSLGPSFKDASTQVSFTASQFPKSARLWV